MKKFLQQVKRFFRFLLNVFTRRLWLKLSSLLLALILWTYIVSTNTSLTRTKQFEDVSVLSGSKADLTAKTLALSTDIQAEYEGAISVSVDVPQSQYSQLKEDNITLTPDYSGINSAGKYEVPLRGNTTYGTIRRMNPSTVLVTVENLESRNFNINLEIVNSDDENYWYDQETAEKSLNPKTISVSGPESILAKVSSAVVQLDAEGMTKNPRRGFSVLLKDTNGDVVPSNLLTLSTSASYVSIGIYPKAALEVTVDEAELEKRIPEGYELVSYSIQPEIITVAADSKTLEAYENLPIRLDEVQDVSGTHTYLVMIPTVFRYYSAGEVTMTVVTQPIGDGETNE